MSAREVTETAPGQLPVTGSGSGQLVPFALVLIAAGLSSLVFASRRRPQ